MQDEPPSQPTTPPPAADANAVENFALGAGIPQLLADKGITSLFDIQSACFAPSMEGKDIVGRARTGCGKTYAFVLPIVTLLMQENVRPIPGGPNVICLLPTRELAKQVRPPAPDSSLSLTAKGPDEKHAPPRTAQSSNAAAALVILLCCVCFQ